MLIDAKRIPNRFPSARNFYFGESISPPDDGPHLYESKKHHPRAHVSERSIIGRVQIQLSFNSKTKMGSYPVEAEVDAYERAVPLNHARHSLASFCPHVVTSQNEIS